MPPSRHNILNSFDDPISIIDVSNFRILDANDKYLNIYGIENEEIVGKTCHEVTHHLLHPCNAPDETCPLMITATTGNHAVNEHIHYKKNGEKIYLEVATTPVTDGNGKIIQVIHVARDITKRKMMEEELSIFKRFAETSNLGYGFSDLDGDIIYINSYLCHLLGEEEPKKVLGKNVVTYYPDDLKPVLLNDILPTVLSKGSWKGELPLMSINGEITPAIQNISLISDDSGKPVYIGNVITNISEHKKAEEDRDQLNKELTRKNKELEEIVYVTSHDLRTPLVNIEGFSKELGKSYNDLTSIILEENIPEYLKAKVASIMESDIAESLTYISKSAYKMDSLLSGLLKLSRIGRSELALEQLDMNNLMIDIVSTVEFQIKKKGVKLKVSDLPSCKGDEAQINQIFSNLIDNALKYLDSGRRGIIKVSGHKDNDKSVYCIEDNGIGIAPEYQEKIYNIFHRLNPDKSSGEGLGLTIVSRAIEKHHGKVWVESDSGKGSKFYVSIPA